MQVARNHDMPHEIVAAFSVMHKVKYDPLYYKYERPCTATIGHGDCARDGRRSQGFKTQNITHILNKHTQVVGLHVYAGYY